VDVRVLAATNQHLEAMMRAGTFREDLYYRLQVIELHVPPLRERREEIPALAEFFLGKYAKVYRRPPVRTSRTLREVLVEYSWPGNIRELENMMKRFVVLQDEQYILTELARLMRAKQMPVAAVVAAGPSQTSTPAPTPVAAAPDPEPADGDDEPLENGAVDGEATVDLQALVKVASIRVEREAIEHALVRFRWNRRKAARYLNVSYKTLLNKMKECGINDPPLPDRGTPAIRAHAR
jgi:two-component system response regulator AtoC